MKIFIIGGTGFIGTALTHRLLNDGHDVTISTRRTRDEHSVLRGITFIKGDSTRKGKRMGQLADHDVTVNLAGASIFKHWNKRNKKAIRDSILKCINKTRNFARRLSPWSSFTTMNPF